MYNIIPNATQNINNTFTFNDLANPLNWEADFLKYSELKIKSDFINALKQADDDFFNSSRRKLLYYAKDIRQRSIVTLFGPVTFNRRRYYNPSSGKYFYYIDYILGLDKFQRVTNQVMANILYNVAYNHDSYRRASEPYQLTKSYVYDVIKKFNSEVYVPYLDHPAEVDYLHIVADEDHVALQNKDKGKKNNSYLLNHVTIFTDVQKECKNRNKLMNKVIFSQLEKEDISDFRDRINEFVLNNYKVNKDIYVYGDGASWIRGLAHDLCGKFILDKFHFQQAICRIAGGKKNAFVRDLLNRYTEYNYKAGVKAIIDCLYPDEEISDYKRQQKTYILKQFYAYTNNFTLPCVFHGCAEGINSHYFSEYLSSRPKGFCKDNLHKIGYLLSLAHSNHDLKVEIVEQIDLYLPEKKNHIQSLKNKVSYETLNNIPIINIGKTTNTKMTALMGLKG